LVNWREIVVELRDKMTKGARRRTGRESEDVVAALMSLGYSQAEAVDAVARASSGIGAD
jgi:Holliday junction resolvasome RuvABC DNA-binding subunit